jgi:hypothetical protein
MKKRSAKTKTERQKIEIVPDDNLEHVVGGRNYGWENGGYGPLGELPQPPIPQLP